MTPDRVQRAFNTILLCIAGLCAGELIVRACVGQLLGDEHIHASLRAAATMLVCLIPDGVRWALLAWLGCAIVIVWSWFAS